MEKIYKTQAFTLVELIVVITILAILGTLGFVSFQGYSVSARDSIRLNDIKVIEKGLSFYSTKGNPLPFPDEALSISSSGTILLQQGYAGAKMLASIEQGEILDPLLNTAYTYTRSTSNIYDYQILGYFEHPRKTPSTTYGSFSFVPLSYGGTNDSEYSDLYPKLFGKPLGILIDSATNAPVQSIRSTPLDIEHVSENYRSYLRSNEFLEGTDNLLQMNPVGSCKRILKLGNNTGDGIYTLVLGGEEIQVYCDMTTDGGGWTIVPENLLAISNLDSDVNIVSDKSGVEITTITDEGGSYCGGRGRGLELEIMINNQIGKFNEVLYSVSFIGNAACWSILGDNTRLANSTNLDVSLESIKFLQSNRMGGINGDYFSGSTYRCDNVTSNFWHGLTNSYGNGERGYQAIQKVLNKSMNTYISNYVDCATPSVGIKYKNIAIR